MELEKKGWNTCKNNVKMQGLEQDEPETDWPCHIRLSQSATRWVTLDYPYRQFITSEYEAEIFVLHPSGTLLGILTQFD